jgi:hypothetical protein
MVMVIAMQVTFGQARPGSMAVDSLEEDRMDNPCVGGEAPAMAVRCIAEGLPDQGHEVQDGACPCIDDHRSR